MGCFPPLLDAEMAVQSDRADGRQLAVRLGSLRGLWGAACDLAAALATWDVTWDNQINTQCFVVRMGAQLGLST